MNRFNNIERLGVNAVEKIVLETNWIARSILQTDVGIDMEVEVCDNGEPTGQLIALQIKSGESYFSEEDLTGIIYRGKNVHLKYWLNHSLPVILVLYNPKTKQTIWEIITDNLIVKTKTNWKISIPKSNILDAQSLEKIKSFNHLPIYFQRLQRLAIHKKMINQIGKGKRFVIEIEEWVNKSSGRAKITVKRIKNNGEELIVNEGHYLHFHGPESLEFLYPWADYEIDDEYYYDSEYDDFLNNYGIWNPEDQIYIGSISDFSEHRERLPRIRAIEDASGEIKTYRLEISLNELGKSFLILNNHLEFGSQLKYKLQTAYNRR